MIRTILLMLVLLRGAADLRGQMSSGGADVAGETPTLARIDSLFAALDVNGSLAAAETLTAVDSGGPAAWRAARAAVALGMLAKGDDAQNEWYRRGEAHAARAVAADSLELDALFWLTAAKGRLALQAGAREAARLGDEVWRLTHRMLARDSDHAGAHNVLGKLQFEVMTLSRVERFLAKVALGDNEALRSSTWEGAEEHLRHAIALEPGVILFHYDLGYLLLRRDRKDDAVAELRTVLSLPVRFPPDEDLQEDARRRLSRLGEEP